MWNFRRLAVWQRSRALAVAISRLCEDFPSPDRVFSDQMKRAALSVGANIAEGSAKSTGRDRARYLAISLGSLSELEHHLLVASDVGYIDSDSVGCNDSGDHGTSANDRVAPACSPQRRPRVLTAGLSVFGLSSLVLPKSVPHRADGGYPGGSFLAELGPKSSDVDIDRSGAPVVLVAPNFG